MYIASNGTKTAVILHDPNAESPRNPMYQENLGKMVCWHRRYNLGDDHKYLEPMDFATDLARDHLPLTGVFSAMKNRELSSFRLIPGPSENDPYTVMVDTGIRNSNWEEMDWKVSRDMQLIKGETSFHLQTDVFDFCTPMELIGMCDKYGDVAIMPLYLYDHSGLSISTGSFVGRAQHADWDSGKVGFIYMDKATAMNELAMPQDTLRLGMFLPDFMREPITVSSRNQEGTFGDILMRNGFEPVQDPALIRNLHDAVPGSDAATIDEEEIRLGKIFKKDHKLYSFSGLGEDGTISMIPVATYNPDLQPLTEDQWKDRALKYLDNEVEEYDNYLRGDVYVLALYEGMEEIESNWGYNPGHMDIRDLMRDDHGLWYGERMNFDYVPDYTFDIEDFYDDHDFPSLRAEITQAVKDFVVQEDMQAAVYPFRMNAADILSNKDGVLDDIVERLYSRHTPPDADDIFTCVRECAGASRAILPKLTAQDLDPDRDYTATELMDILKDKPPLQDVIRDAQRRQALQHQTKDAQGTDLEH